MAHALCSCCLSLLPAGPAAPVLPELEILPHELQGLAHIGQGGFGRVYRALYTRTHTHVRSRGWLLRHSS